MPFDWAEYRALADRLSQEDNEAAQRSAISRAYYSVFCQARNYLLDEGFSISGMGPGTHQQVWNEFQRRGRTYKPIGIEGNRLHRFRVRADYEEAVSNLKATMQESFRVADKVLYYLNQVKDAAAS